MFLDAVLCIDDQMFNLVRLESSMSGLCFAVFVFAFVVMYNLRPASCAIIHKISNWIFAPVSCSLIYNMTCQKQRVRMLCQIQFTAYKYCCYTNFRFLSIGYSEISSRKKRQLEIISLKGRLKISVHNMQMFITCLIRELMFWFKIKAYKIISCILYAEKLNRLRLTKERWNIFFLFY